MIARFLIALLMAVLSVPAMASMERGHCDPAPQAMSGHHGGHHEAPPAPEPSPAPSHASNEACIGCIAPSTLPAPSLAKPLAHPAPPRVATGASGAPYGPSRPATPPPRA